MKSHKELLLTALTAIVPVCFQLIYVRYISYSVDKEVYGNFILLQTLVVALSYVFLQIPTSAYSRFYNGAPDKIAYVNEFRTILVVINILSLVCILLFGYVYQKFSLAVLLSLFFYFVLLNNFSFNKEIFLLNLDRKTYFYLKIIESVAKYLFPIGMYFVFGTLLSFILGLAFGYSVSFLILLLRLKNYPFKFRLELSNVKKYFVYAYPVIITASLSWGINLSDRYFIEFFMETREVAIYAILAQVAGFGSILGQIYGMYVNPIIFKKYEADRRDALTLLNKYVRTLVIIFCLCSIVLLYLPKDIFTILVEPGVITNNVYYYSLLVLTLSSFMAVTQNAFAMYFVLEKKLEIITYAYAIAFAANFLGNFFIEDYGVIAASISTLVAFTIINFVQCLYVKVAIRP